MESGINCSIPRGEERAGYGEQNQVFHTPQSEKIARIEQANGENSQNRARKWRKEPEEAREEPEEARGEQRNS